MCKWHLGLQRSVCKWSAYIYPIYGLNLNCCICIIIIIVIIVIIVISGLHHYECIAPLVANSLQSGRFSARSTASVDDSPWESRSFCTVFIQVIHGCPGGLFQYTEGEKLSRSWLPHLLWTAAGWLKQVKYLIYVLSPRILAKRYLQFCGYDYYSYSEFYIDKLKHLLLLLLVT